MLDILGVSSLFSGHAGPPVDIDAPPEPPCNQAKYNFNHSHRKCVTKSCVSNRQDNVFMVVTKFGCIKLCFQYVQYSLGVYMVHNFAL